MIDAKSPSMNSFAHLPPVMEDPSDQDLDSYPVASYSPCWDTIEDHHHPVPRLCSQLFQQLRRFVALSAEMFICKVERSLGSFIDPLQCEQTGIAFRPLIDNICGEIEILRWRHNVYRHRVMHLFGRSLACLSYGETVLANDRLGTACCLLGRSHSRLSSRTLNACDTRLRLPPCCLLSCCLNLSMVGQTESRLG